MFTYSHNTGTRGCVEQRTRGPGLFEVKLIPQTMLVVIAPSLFSLFFFSFFFLTETRFEDADGELLMWLFVSSCLPSDLDYIKWGNCVKGQPRGFNHIKITWCVNTLVTSQWYDIYWDYFKKRDLKTWYKGQSVFIKTTFELWTRQYMQKSAFFVCLSIIFPQFSFLDARKLKNFNFLSSKLAGTSTISQTMSLGSTRIRKQSAKDDGYARADGNCSSHFPSPKTTWCFFAQRTSRLKPPRHFCHHTVNLRAAIFYFFNNKIICFRKRYRSRMILFFIWESLLGLPFLFPPLPWSLKKSCCSFIIHSTTFELS